MPKKYKLIREPRLEDFESQINHYLNEGWELYGSPLQMKIFCIKLFIVIKKVPLKVSQLGAFQIKTFRLSLIYRCC